MNTILVKVSDLAEFAVPYNAPDGYLLGDEIIRRGWDDNYVLPIRLHGRRRAQLLDGNHRIDYLARRGHGEVTVPVRILFGPTSRKLDKPQHQH